MKTSEKRLAYAKSYYRRRKEAGLCFACNSPATRGVRCEKHYQMSRIANKARKNGSLQRYCADCGVEIARYKRICSGCRVGRYVKASESLLIKKREEYIKTKEEGVCVMCKKSPPLEGRVHCEVCQEKNRKRGRKRNEK